MEVEYMLPFDDMYKGPLLNTYRNKDKMKAVKYWNNHLYSAQIQPVYQSYYSEYKMKIVNHANSHRFHHIEWKLAWSNQKFPNSKN